ncbi:MAG: hypothetical protein ACXV2C_00055 [Candidatus Bathyarchaeia archaeon]
MVEAGVSLTIMYGTQVNLLAPLIIENGGGFQSLGTRDSPINITIDGRAVTDDLFYVYDGPQERSFKIPPVLNWTMLHCSVQRSLYFYGKLAHTLIETCMVVLSGSCSLEGINFNLSNQFTSKIANFEMLLLRAYNSFAKE